MPRDDRTTTVFELREAVKAFVDARDWSQFHTPKNIAMSLAIEAAELMEHFQWLTPDESRGVSRQVEKLSEVGEELSDVLCYALALANELGIDVASAFAAKMKKNELKYPVEEIRGRWGHEDGRGVKSD